VASDEQSGALTQLSPLNAMLRHRTVGTGLVGAPACGDVMKLQIDVDENGARATSYAHTAPTHTPTESSGATAVAAPISTLCQLGIDPSL
jgi:hypothetical protein